MKATDLYGTLNGLIPGEMLSKNIANEVEEYKFQLQKKGLSIPIKFIEDRAIFLTKSFGKRLLNEAYEGSLSNIHLAYICDCLTLGEKVTFENEVLKDIIYEIADPEINGSFKSAKEILSFIHKLN